jgi:hypothetical protein
VNRFRVVSVRFQAGFGMVAVGFARADTAWFRDGFGPSSKPSVGCRILAHNSAQNVPS